jgi:hypothetical protein
VRNCTLLILSITPVRSGSTSTGVTRERWDANRVLRDAVLYRMLLLTVTTHAAAHREP